MLQLNWSAEEAKYCCGGIFPSHASSRTAANLFLLKVLVTDRQWRTSRKPPIWSPVTENFTTMILGGILGPRLAVKKKYRKTAISCKV